MRAVGIKQLKSRLSEYFRMARADETILVSDRDEVVAELGPARHQRPQADSVEAVLDDLADRKLVTRASQPKKGDLESAVARAAAGNRKEDPRRATRGPLKRWLAPSIWTPRPFCAPLSNKG